MSNTAIALLNEANKHIGITGRPNLFTKWYAKRHGDAFLTAAWCDMSVTYNAAISGAMAALPKGDRAYTPWHAQDFDNAGRWYLGTSTNIRHFAEPGDIVFFDWNGSNTINNVDHVGILVRNLGDGRLVTLEGNTSDKVALRVRGSDVIAGFGKPKWEYVPPISDVPDAWPYKSTTLMRKGWHNSTGVRKVQEKLNDLGYLPKLAEDGDFGIKTENAVKWFQRHSGLVKDGIVGKVTWAKLFN